jgi:adenylylsulfate kinase
MKSSRNVVWHKSSVLRADRERLNGHRSIIIWFTGLSSSGKSTISHAVEEQLFQRKHKTFVFDGDNVRHGLCSDLGFSKEDRTENLRRIGEMVKLFAEAGVIALTAFISPIRKDRERIRNMVPDGDFIEIHCQCSVETCEQRDAKGVYGKARKGEIKNFTGISAPYEAPDNPEIFLETSALSVKECTNKILKYLDDKNLLNIKP